MPENQKQQNSNPANPSDSGASQGKGLPDDPRQAAESGEPKEAGRSHGRVVTDQKAESGKGGEAPAPGAKGNTDKVGVDYESGRQDAL